MDSFKASKYKMVSASAAAVESVAKPSLKHSHKVMLEGSEHFYEGIYGTFDEADKGSKGKFSWFFKGLKKVTRGFHKLTNYGIIANYQDSVKTLNALENGLNKQQEELEKVFNENGINVHDSWVFSSENRDTIRQITAFIKEETADLKSIPYNRIWQYLIAYTIVQKKARMIIWEVQPYPIPDHIRLTDMAYFCPYSVGIYGKLLVKIMIEKKKMAIFKSISGEQIFKNYCNIQDEDMLYFSPDSGRNMPVHAIVLDHSRQAVVLCIRGTMAVFDCLADLQGEYLEYQYKDPFTQEVQASGFVHEGIFRSAERLAASLKERVLEILASYPTYHLCIIGHSLGAGATALLSLIWMSDPEMMERRFSAFAYAPPAVLSEELNDVLKTTLMSCSFGNDIVTRMSFGSIKDICEVVSFLNQRERTGDGLRPSRIVNAKLFKQNLSDDDYIQLYTDIKEKMSCFKLCAPGHMFQMFNKLLHPDASLLMRFNPNDSQIYYGEFIDHHYYDQIVLSKTVISDHMPDNYEKGLKYLVNLLT